MSISSTTNRVSYTGNAVTTQFAFPYAFIEKAHLKVLVDGVLQVTGYTVYFTNELANPGVPSSWGPDGYVLFTVAPANAAAITIYRDPSPIQEIQTQENVKVPSPTLETALDRIYMVFQRIFDIFDRTPKFDETFVPADFDTTIPAPVADTFIGVNAAGDGFVLKTATEIASEGTAGSGVPTGGDTGDFLEKNSSTDADASWKTANYSGISSRFGAWSSSGLKDTLDQLIAITYTAPTISLSGSSNSLREKGTSVASVTLTATIVKKSDPIARVRFYQGASLLSTQTGNPPVPSGGAPTQVYSTPFSDNISFSAEVDDTGVTGGPSTVSSSTSYSFVYPYYSDAGAAGKTAAQVGALTKSIIVSTATVIKTMTATAGQVFYFAYPAAYGALTSILDVNNFETISDWTRTTQNITGLDATAQSYYIYEFNNPVLAGTYQYTFKR